MRAQSVMPVCRFPPLGRGPPPGRGPDLSCRSGLGVLTGEITPGLVDEVIEQAGCREKRQRLLPARAVVYFVLGLCLFSGADSMGPPGYRSVMRWLTNGLRHLDGAGLATSSALTRARQRLGARPLELLFGLRCGPLAEAGTPGAFAFGLRLAAWDGTGIDAADTPANAAAFGGVQGGGPQLRLLALIECGTHALIGAVSGGVARASEQKLARRLLPALGPGMLLLADRNFPGWELQGLAAGTGADLAWRIKKNLVFTPLQVLADGSFLSVMPTPAENVRLGQARAAGRPRPARPRVTWSGSSSTRSPSAPLAAHQDRAVPPGHHAAGSPAGASRRARLPLPPAAGKREQLRRAEDPAPRRRVHPALPLTRTGLPGTVRVPHRLPGALRPGSRSRRQAGIDPDRISFTVTVRVARDHAASHAIITPHSLDLARRQAIGDLLSDLLPRRRDRQYERIRKQPKNNFPPLKRGQERLPSRVTYTIKVTPRAPSPAQTP